MIYMFDVDGTLTPSRGAIDSLFESFFINFCSNNKVILVTGSDRVKTIEQVGEKVYNSCYRVYQCSGNDIWEGTNNVATKEFIWPDNLEDFCDYWIAHSNYNVRTGNHKDVRPGLLNFSIVGRNATREQRADYVAYDEYTKERELIARLVNEKFPNYEANVAGETGIDITQKGCGKEQIIHDFDAATYKISFFGDKMERGGNDHKLSLEVSNRGGNVYHVKDWMHTWEILKLLA
jgi:phosphomannomutase